MEREKRTKSARFVHGSYSSHTKSTTTTTNNNSGNNNSWMNYQIIEQQINNKAKAMTIDYLKKTRVDDCGRGDDQSLQEQVFLVYKFISTPIDIITAGMRTMMREQATQYYRRLAKQLHPDKNQHPLAKEAF